MKKTTYLILVLIIVLSQFLSACGANTAPSSEDVQPTVQHSEAEVMDTSAETEAAVVDTSAEAESTIAAPRPTGWTEETHGKETEPDYEVVFPQDEVNRLDITITADTWEMMLADMTSLYGEFGANPRRAGQVGQPGQKPTDTEGQPPQNNGVAPPARGNRLQGDGALEGDESNPMWATVTIEFEGDIWENVGLRFKGNSSLSSSWGSGSYKLPLKLDFDEFEDEYPEIDDQRFYGFKQLSLSSNFNDNTLLHEKVAADIFRESGVPAAQTAFYEVYVDYGEGSTYLGLYTMVEVVDDTVIETQFEDDNGNVYKPSGAGATFAANSFSENSFDKETNQDEADYSDILALYRALHNETRLTNPENWRSELESVFDVDGFLRYLAVNTVIQNWDAYGRTPHNYYLYNNPETGLLTWIPWDNNEAFSARKMGGALSVSLDEVGSDWPLISYLMDDPVYNKIYTTYLAKTIAGPFNPDHMAETYQSLAALIAPYAAADVGEDTFNNAIQQLIAHAYQRTKAVNGFLSSLEK